MGEYGREARPKRLRRAPRRPARWRGVDIFRFFEALALYDYGTVPWRSVEFMLESTDALMQAVEARTNAYWLLHEKTMARDAKRTGEKRGFSGVKTLAAAKMAAS